MKNLRYLLIVLLPVGLLAQTALYNSGNIRIHDGGQIGFHTDLINNGAFDQNLGLVGFYGNTALTISGAFMPEFYEVEIVNDQGISLNIATSASANANFVAGNIFTPRPQQDIYFNFHEEAFYVGAGDLNKIDGYAALNNKENFIFPVGDAEQLRPLTLNSSGSNDFAKCAYYYENPTNTSSFSQNFNPSRKSKTLEGISEVEFWHLEGSVSSSIQIGWNQRSNLAALTSDVSKITPVGWSISGKSWVNLGAANVVGDLNEGFLISNNFIPDNYAIITFGAEAMPTELLTLDNYLVTPNNDGINDALYIPELERSNDDNIRIFNRSGLKVYEENNYTNGFTGYANINSLVVNREAGLPNGLYYYIIEMKDLQLNYQGYLYLEH